MKIYEIVVIFINYVEDWNPDEVHIYSVTMNFSRNEGPPILENEELCKALLAEALNDSELDLPNITIRNALVVPIRQQTINTYLKSICGFN